MNGEDVHREVLEIFVEMQTRHGDPYNGCSRRACLSEDEREMEFYPPLRWTGPVKKNRLLREPWSDQKKCNEERKRNPELEEALREWGNR